MPLDRVRADLAPALRGAHDAIVACRTTVDVLGRHTGAIVAAALRVNDHLRCVAATGSWQAYASMPADSGIVGRVYSTGKTAVVTDVTLDPDYLPLGPDVAVEICAPLTDLHGQPIGALTVEWTTPVEVDGWTPVVEGAAQTLSARVGELGGTPPETRSEQMLRHTLAITAATDEVQLLDRSIEAACDVSGLSAALLLLPTRTGVRAFPGTVEPGSLGERLSRHLAGVDQLSLARLMYRARGHGTSYSLGDPAVHDASGFEVLTDAGVRTMIAIPAGPPEVGGVLLVVDEVPSSPGPTMANLLELLGAHSWTAVERMSTLRRLRDRADSDPLTGLHHHGPFGERLAEAAPGRTALLAIDVDQFKTVNDMYGHQVGDRVLVDLARALQQTLRGADELYRIGGDEFVAVLEIRGPAEATAIAERLCAAARRTGRTISIGVAIQADGEAPDLTLRRADSALYEAKRTGRDCIKIAA